MQRMHVVAVLAAAIMTGMSGCQSTDPSASAPGRGDLQFAEALDATVTPDQKIVMDGKKLKIADVPKQLAKKRSSQYITIVVYPESKMSRETLIELVNAMIKTNYFVNMGPNSKYADVPIPVASRWEQ